MQLLCKVRSEPAGSEPVLDGIAPLVQQGFRAGKFQAAGTGVITTDECQTWLVRPALTVGIIRMYRQKLLAGHNNDAGRKMQLPVKVGFQPCQYSFVAGKPGCYSG